MYAGCLFLSIKYVVDTHNWFIEDFSCVSGFDPKIIEKMEAFVLMDILNFQFYISDLDYSEELLKARSNV